MIKCDAYYTGQQSRDFASCKRLGASPYLMNFGLLITNMIFISPSLEQLLSNRLFCNFLSHFQSTYMLPTNWAFYVACSSMNLAQVAQRAMKMLRLMCIWECRACLFKMVAGWTRYRSSSYTDALILVFVLMHVFYRSYRSVCLFNKCCNICCECMLGLKKCTSSTWVVNLVIETNPMLLAGVASSISCRIASRLRPGRSTCRQMSSVAGPWSDLNR